MNNLHDKFLDDFLWVHKIRGVHKSPKLVVGVRIPLYLFKHRKKGKYMDDTYFTKLYYLTSLEDELTHIHRVVRQSCDQEAFLIGFGTSKEFYEEDAAYRHLVDNFEKLERAIEPEVVELLHRGLRLCKKFLKENNYSLYMSR